MLKNKLQILVVLCFMMLMTSCSEYSKMLKSTNNDEKYEMAMKLYDQGSYYRALQLFDLLQSAYRGTQKGEHIAYCTAYCYFNLEDYEIAGFYFKRFAQNFPFSKDAQDMLFMNAYCHYLDSPNSSLDQTNTKTAISEFQYFIDTYPKSSRVSEANEYIDKLRDKLQEKEYNICMLYYKMGDYMAAITSFENLLKHYPATRHKEEILYNMALTYYDFAENSIEEKKQERYEASIEKYNTLLYLYPESKYIKELESVQTKVRSKLINK